MHRQSAHAGGIATSGEPPVQSAWIATRQPHETELDSGIRPALSAAPATDKSRAGASQPESLRLGNRDGPRPNAGRNKLAAIRESTTMDDGLDSRTMQISRQLQLSSKPTALDVTLRAK